MLRPRYDSTTLAQARPGASQANRDEPSGARRNRANGEHAAAGTETMQPRETENTQTHARPAGGPGSGQPCVRRRATSASVTAAATLAFSDSTVDAIGMLTRMSHVSPTSRDRPRPSDPTTTSSGPTAASSW